jgi:hypothetical protein
MNPAVTLDFNIGATASHTFTKIQVQWLIDSSMIALKSNGTLWYNISAGAPYTNWAITDSTWRQYGTDTDWTDIAAANNAFSAVKGGALMFVGGGNYVQRGDGVTGGTNSWIVTNNALTWAKTSLGYYSAQSCTTSGHVYFCGYNWNYMTGQGTTAGSTTVWTRDQFNITGVTDVAQGDYNMGMFLASGNLYATGYNVQSQAGPLITSTGNLDGPVLSYNGGDVVFLTQPTYWSTYAINTSGQLMFAGSAISNTRPDNVNTNQQGALGFGVIDGGSTGWTFYHQRQAASNRYNPCVAIKNGQMSMGGGVYSYPIKQVLGYPANTSAWVNVGPTGVTAASSMTVMIAASW